MTQINTTYKMNIGAQFDCVTATNMPDQLSDADFMDLTSQKDHIAGVQQQDVSSYAQQWVTIHRPHETGAEVSTNEAPWHNVAAYLQPSGPSTQNDLHIHIHKSGTSIQAQDGQAQPRIVKLG